MFHTLHKSIKCPREFTNMQMLVLFMVENFQMLWPLLHICNLNNFGHVRLTEEEFQAKLADGTITDAERQVYSEPGPFSVYAYLKNLLKPSFYGDELCLLVVTMIWKVQITVLHAKTFLALKFRHMNQSMRADFILVHCSGSHYIPLGISLHITSFFNFTLFIPQLFLIYQFTYFIQQLFRLYINFPIYLVIYICTQSFAL